MRECKNLISGLMISIYLCFSINIAVAGNINFDSSTLSPQLVINALQIQSAFDQHLASNDVTFVEATPAELLVDDYQQKITPQFFTDFIEDWVTSQKKLFKLGQAFFIFGSARFKPGHKWYEQAKKFGGLCAECFVSIITGGGPGTMLGANEGAYGIGGVDSVGLGMELPHEKDRDHTIFKNVVKIFKYFFTRKLMFIQKALGGISVPGGFGTQDEIFEILAFNKRYTDQARINVLVDEPFYGGFYRFLEGIADRGLMPHPRAQSLVMKNSVEAGFNHLLLNTSGLKAKELDIDLKLFINDLFRASRVLDRMGPSVGIIGGSLMQEDTIYWHMAKRLAGSLSALNMNIIRRGNKGIAAAVGRSYDEFEQTHGFERGINVALHEDGKRVWGNSTDLSLNFEYYFALKIALMEYSKLGIVVFPGGVDTIDVVYEVLCLIKTNKIDSVPIVLVGRDFWQPWIEWMRDQMIPAGTINADYLDLIQVVDDEVAAQQIIQDNLMKIKEKSDAKLAVIAKLKFTNDLKRQKAKETGVGIAIKKIFKSMFGPIEPKYQNGINLDLIERSI